MNIIAALLIGAVIGYLLGVATVLYAEWSMFRGDKPGDGK